MNKQWQTLFVKMSEVLSSRSCFCDFWILNKELRTLSVHLRGTEEEREKKDEDKGKKVRGIERGRQEW